MDAHDKAVKIARAMDELRKLMQPLLDARINDKTLEEFLMELVKFANNNDIMVPYCWLPFIEHLERHRRSRT